MLWVVSQNGCDSVNLRNVELLSIQTGITEGEYDIHAISSNGRTILFTSNDFKRCEEILNKILIFPYEISHICIQHVLNLSKEK
jgi:hypothetical protein